jgi:hypothetical protein
MGFLVAQGSCGRDSTAVGLPRDRSGVGSVLELDAGHRHRRRGVPGSSRALPGIDRGDRGIRTERRGRAGTVRVARDPRRRDGVRSRQRGPGLDESRDIAFLDSVRLRRIRCRDRPTLVYWPSEIHRVLRHGGRFVTQQRSEAGASGIAWEDLFDRPPHVHGRFDKPFAVDQLGRLRRSRTRGIGEPGRMQHGYAQGPHAMARRSLRAPRASWRRDRRRSRQALRTRGIAGRQVTVIFFGSEFAAEPPAILRRSARNW